MTAPTAIAACHCCGLLQRLPLPVTPALAGTGAAGERLVCARCGTRLGHGDPNRNQWTAALALAALMFYPAAIALPLLRMEQLGHSHTDSLLSGLVGMFSHGYWLVGTVVLLFSVLLPPIKLVALWFLTRPPAGRTPHRHRALVYHAVELLGRWGMLDVMLVAVLVAMVKLGDLVHIHPGPGLWAFILLVLLSMVASMVFNPTLMWDERDSDPEPR